MNGEVENFQTWKPISREPIFRIKETMLCVGTIPDWRPGLTNRQIETCRGWSRKKSTCNYDYVISKVPLGRGQGPLLGREQKCITQRKKLPKHNAGSARGYLWVIHEYGCTRRNGNCAQNRPIWVIIKWAWNSDYRDNCAIQERIKMVQMSINRITS